MKKIFLTAFTLLLLPLAAFAGDIKPGAVPGSINYQGRLERDNAPVTGPVHLFFRIYNASSGGTKRWESGILTAQAAQGIFSANIVPGWDVFARSEQLYLEVQVESDVLTPREPLGSVAYAIVAKRLEDGASISVTTLTANYQVLLATAADSKVGIGTDAPTDKLTVFGRIQLWGPGSAICYDDLTCTTSMGVGTAVGGVNANGDSTIAAGAGGTGNMYFVTAGTERMRLNDNVNGGRIGIGAGALAAPLGTLDIDGSLYVGNAGIYDRDDSEINIRENLKVGLGRVTGVAAEYIGLGETPDVITLFASGGERMRVHSNGNIGIGLLNPGANLQVQGDIQSNAGVRGGVVSMGTYAGAWTGLANEVRSQSGSHLLLQQSTPYNVGIGTDTPREKLHVRGSVLSDYGVIAATAAFSGAVGVNGDFTANGNNRRVYLTSTTIYGTLSVSGGIGSTAGMPAYINSTQTLTGLNTFLNQVTVSSDIVTINRVGVGVADFDFPASKYLQVGDNQPAFANDNANAYLVGGSAANAKLNFYRGPAEAARLETQGGQNLALVVDGKVKTYNDAVYNRIQEGVVWISTGFNTTPAIYISSKDGNIGIGTTVSDPNEKITLAGNLKIVGALTNGITFPDGSHMYSNATIGAAQSISNPGDALVWANTTGSGGNVVLRSGPVTGLVVDPSGSVGIGTIGPVSRLTVRNGDLVIGSPVNPYNADGIDDLIVAGKIVFDGAIIQRSVSAAQFSALIVPGDVFLSTGVGARTGIATIAPATTFDVNGDAQFGLTGTKSRFTTAGVLQLDTPLGAGYGGTGTNLSASGGANQFVRQSAAGAALSVSAIADADVPDTITLTNITQITNRALTSLTGTLTVGNGGTGATTLTGVLHGNGAGAFTAANVALGSEVTGTLPVGSGGTGATTLTGVLHGNGAGAFTAADVALGSEVSGTLPVANGGAGGSLAATGGANQFVRQSAAGAALSVSAIADADVPDTITLTNITQITNRALTSLTGTLTVGNGGTGATTLTGVLHGNGAGAFTAANVALGSEVTGTLPVGSGGTGAGTFVLNGVLYGNGTGAVQDTAAGAANTVLRGTGGAPTFGTIDSNYTTGGSSGADFEVISSTQGAGTCRTMRVTNGMVTTISGTHACP